MLHDDSSLTPTGSVIFCFWKPSFNSLIGAISARALFKELFVGHISMATDTSYMSLWPAREVRRRSTGAEGEVALHDGPYYMPAGWLDAFYEASAYGQIHDEDERLAHDGFMALVEVDPSESSASRDNRHIALRGKRQEYLDQRYQLKRPSEVFRLEFTQKQIDTIDARFAELVREGVEVNVQAFSTLDWFKYSFRKLLCQNPERPRLTLNCSGLVAELLLAGEVGELVPEFVRYKRWYSRLISPSTLINFLTSASFNLFFYCTTKGVFSDDVVGGIISINTIVVSILYEKLGSDKKYRTWLYPRGFSHASSYFIALGFIALATYLNEGVLDGKKFSWKSGGTEIAFENFVVFAIYLMGLSCTQFLSQWFNRLSHGTEDLVRPDGVADVVRLARRIQLYDRNVCTFLSVSRALPVAGAALGALFARYLVNQYSNQSGLALTAWKHGAQLMGSSFVETAICMALYGFGYFSLSRNRTVRQYMLKTFLHSGVHNCMNIMWNFIGIFAALFGAVMVINDNEEAIDEMGDWGDGIKILIATVGPAFACLLAHVLFTAIKQFVYPCCLSEDNEDLELALLSRSEQALFGFSDNGSEVDIEEAVVLDQDDVSDISADEFEDDLVYR